MNIQKVIEQLGYKRKEAEFYLASLQLGEAKISDLAEKLKIPRTSALMIAEKLQKDGLLSYYVKRLNKYWVAENPDKLLSKLKTLETTLLSVLPSLKAMELKTAVGKPTVKVYVGAQEIQHIFTDIVMTKNNFRAIVAWNDLSRIVGFRYLADFIDTHVSHFLKFRLLTPKSDVTALLRKSDLKEMRETCFLSKHTTALNTATFMYGNKIAIISLNETLSTGFLIEDIDVHNTMTVFFEELWGGASVE
jgi:sugar-specific transcriptional regulator TrmB